jgi:hypothetical protein
MSEDDESSSTVTLEDAHVQVGSTVTILCTSFGEAFAKGYAQDHGGDWKTGRWEGVVMKKAPDHKNLPGQPRWYVRFKDDAKNTAVAEIDLTVTKQPENRRLQAQRGSHAAQKRPSRASTSTGDGSGSGSGSGRSSGASRKKARAQTVLAAGYDSDVSIAPINFQAEKEQETTSAEGLLRDVKWEKDEVRIIDPCTTRDSNDELLNISQTQAEALTATGWLDIWFPTDIIFARGVKYSNMYIKQQNIMRDAAHRCLPSQSARCTLLTR